MSSDVRVSVVTSMFRSSPYLEEFYSRALRAVSSISNSYEFVLVNDGSPDDSLAVALRIRQRDPRVRVVDLSRNFGHHRALMTGLAHSRGELVFLLDCDLEEEPEWLVRFHETLRETGTDVVYGVQQSRKGGVVERIGGQFFYALMNRMLTEPLPKNVTTARLMTQRYVRALVQHRDREIFLGGLLVLTGFDQRPLPVVKGSRRDTTYSLRARISMAVNAITSLSSRPLIYIFYLGAAVVSLSSLAAFALVVRALTSDFLVPGYASLIVSIWFLGGLTIFCLGILGIYLAKIFTETKDRPYTIVRAEYGTPDLAEQNKPLTPDAAAVQR